MTPAENSGFFGKSELLTIQKAIREEGLDGWLFCNFRHRDRLSDEILKIKPGTTNSRLWVYAVPADGEPEKLAHAVESSALDALPGRKQVYSGREELLAALKPLGKKKWGVHSSETLTAISYLDAGTAATLEKAGLILESAAGLVQRFQGILDAEGIRSHEKSAAHLYEIVEIAWEMVKTAFAGKKELREGDIRDLMLQEMKSRGLVTDHSPIVAAGPNSADPHYDFSGCGALIREGDVIQFDLWAKDGSDPRAIYADISWVGIFASLAPPKVVQCFRDLAGAREGALGFIEEELAAGRGINGLMVDKKARDILSGLGYRRALKHRTGHGIDRDLHGSGVNMDSVEFPDPRPLLEGSCFSLEPGIYFSPDTGVDLNFGLRTEIDVYIQNGKPVISGDGSRRQFSLLTC